MQNYIIQLNNYCLEYSLNIKNEFPIEEEIEIESKGIESLFNDEKTSDVKIKMGQDKYLYCHKTILTSKSTFFNALFESGSTFSDLSQDGIFTPDESEDLDLLEIVIKSCYGILDEKDCIDSNFILSILDMSLKHEIVNLINYCQKQFILTIDNYAEMVGCVEKYFHLESFCTFYQKLITFAVDNRVKLFTNPEKYLKLPQSLFHEIFQIILQLSCNNMDDDSDDDIDDELTLRCHSLCYYSKIQKITHVLTLLKTINKVPIS